MRPILQSHLKLFCVLIVTCIAINACRRIQQEELNKPKEIDEVESKFFAVPASIDPLITTIAGKIRRQNENSTL